MMLALLLVLLVLGSAIPICSALSGSGKESKSSYQSISGMSVGAAFPEDLPGVLPPVGFFDPLGFAETANAATLKRYREAELTHGRVAMLAAVGFLVGEKVEGSSFFFDAQISGPAITHLTQVPNEFWISLIAAIGAVEQYRAEKGWVDPSEVPADEPGLLRDDYIPGDLAFDPLGFRNRMDENEFFDMQTKELQHGRLAMIAASGFLAQEAVDGKGIVEHWQAI